MGAVIVVVIVGILIVVAQAVTRSGDSGLDDSPHSAPVTSTDTGGEDSPATPAARIAKAIAASDVDSGELIKNFRGRHTYAVKFKIKDGLTQGLIRAGMAQDTFSLMQHIYESGAPFQQLWLEGTGKVQDKYGQESDAVVYRTMFTRGTIAKINFDNVDTTSLTLVKELADTGTYVLPDLDG